MWIICLFPLFALCCQKPGSNPGGESETPAAPTAISLSESNFSAAPAGETLSLTVTAPARPTWTVPAAAKDWLSVKDGVYKDYKITLSLVVAANTAYEPREAEISIAATGVSAVTVKVAQQGREVIADPVLPENAAVVRSRELGLGWNLGNHFDAYVNGVASETAWGCAKATEATFTGVKAAGFTSVRIPVTWLGHIGDAPDYTLDADWLNRVYEVVGYAEKAGLKVILNTHHDEDHGDAHWLNLAGAVNSEDTNTQVKAEIAAVWRQIAEKFKAKGDFLMLESFNELIFGSDWTIGSNPQKKADVINQWNQVFVDAVRATGGNNATRWLGVPGYAASPQYLQYLTVPQDPAGKTMLAFHCYDPYDYTIGPKQLSDWGHTGTAYPRGEEEIKALFNSIYTNYIAKNIPVYMGEFGCSLRDRNNRKAWAYFLYYLEYVVKCAKVFGIPAFLWDNGAEGAGQEHHAYINHGTGQYCATGEEPVRAMARAWNSSDAGYTLQSVYDSAPVF